MQLCIDRGDLSCCYGNSGDALACLQPPSAFPRKVLEIAVRKTLEGRGGRKTNTSVKVILSGSFFFGGASATALWAEMVMVVKRCGNLDDTW